MILILESIAACALFTLFVFLISRDPVKIVYNYPPAIIDRCRSLGLLDDFNRRGGTAFYVKKVTAMSFIGVLLGLLLGLSLGASAQTVRNASYQTVAHIKSDGTVQDASYRTIGHAGNIQRKWAAFYFFFSK